MDMRSQHLSAFAALLSPAHSASHNFTLTQPLPSRFPAHVYASCLLAGPFGDWPVCAPTADKSSHAIPASTGCRVLSFGIANEFEFDDAMARQFGCAVHSYDPSSGYVVEQMQHDVPNVTFHYRGLGNGKPGSLATTFEARDNTAEYGSVVGPLRTLREHMDELAWRSTHVLKVDCEGCEWEAFEQIARSEPKLLSHVQFLLIELHFSPQHQLGSDRVDLAAAFYDHVINVHGFKPFYIFRTGAWPSAADKYGERDQRLKANEAWARVGGKYLNYNVGFVNPNFIDA